MLSEADIIYLRSLGFNGTAPDLLYSFLNSKGVTPIGALPDMYYNWLVSLISSPPSALQDMLDEALFSASGYTKATLPSGVSLIELIDSTTTPISNILIEYLMTMSTEGEAKFLLLLNTNKSATLQNTMTLYDDFSVSATFSTLGSISGSGSLTILSSHIGYIFRVYVDKNSGHVVGEVGTGSSFVPHVESTTIVTNGDRYTVTFAFDSATDTYTLEVDGVVEDTLVNVTNYSPHISFIGQNAVGSSDFVGVLYSVILDKPGDTRTYHFTSKNSAYEVAQEDPDDAALYLNYTNVVEDDWYTVADIMTHNNEIVYHNGITTLTQ